MAERMVMSDGLAGGDQRDVIALCIPNVQQVIRATQSEDRQGTDFWAILRSGHQLSVDIKVRETDPLDRFGLDDLLIEWRSSEEAGAPGWTVDPNKRTDYVLYWFESTKRYALLPFPLLHAVAVANEALWSDRFGVRRSYSSRDGRTWTTTWSPVPRPVIWRAVYELSNGARAA